MTIDRYLHERDINNLQLDLAYLRKDFKKLTKVLTRMASKVELIDAEIADDDLTELDIRVDQLERSLKNQVRGLEDKVRDISRSPAGA